MLMPLLKLTPALKRERKYTLRLIRNTPSKSKCSSTVSSEPRQKRSTTLNNKTPTATRSCSTVTAIPLMNLNLGRKTYRLSKKDKTASDF